MLSRLNFDQVFFSQEIVKYLDKSDIPSYRSINKKANKTKIELYYHSQKYELQLIKEIFPLSINESKILDTTLYRYKNLFDNLQIKTSSGDCISRSLKIDYWKDIDSCVKTDLTIKNKKYYIYTHYIDIHNFYVHNFILAFSSQEELLSFSLDVRTHLSNIIFSDTDIQHIDDVGICEHCHFYGNNVINYEFTIYLDKNYKHCMIRDYGRRFTDFD